MFSRIREDIANIMSRDPAARSVWEVLTCYPGLHAISMHRMAHWFWLNDLKWIARFTAHISRGLTGIEIHPGATIGARVFIDHGLGVVIGETAVVGDECTIYQGVTLGGTSLSRGEKRHPTLERGVIIGAGAKVLGAFTVGEGAKVGSNAVVVNEVPAGATATGIPARIAPKKGSGQEKTRSRVFSAYGVTPDRDDPLSVTLHGLIDHSESHTHQIEQILLALKNNGINCDAFVSAEKPEPEKLTHSL